MSPAAARPEPTPGLVVVDKPGGMTSHDVVSRGRRLLGTRKVGHAGTLDPMATGVLVLGVGRATRLLGHLLLSEKAYAATVRLGATTTTDDAEGDLLVARPTGHVTDDDVRRVLAGFVGELDQVPSAVSAVKVDGKRAYQRVRDGETVELAPRRVTIHDLQVHDVRLGEDHVDVDLSVRCSSGTYVRAIARDAGEALGVGGHLTALRRTSVGPFGLEVARTLEELAESPGVLPIHEAARIGFPGVDLDDAQATDVRIGRRLDLDLGHPGPVALFAPGGAFLALYEQAGEQARAVAVFTG
ncbi:tRNA pseudouridine synthase B [Nocardioides scoriae]|uniref:tRNA pseudouridine synthase B n=1 Tax=Nocardioides scoriae TaxID=642780 RepID=A0A1H1L4V3_9ACTN|nr:tRNA pseudouridine(55) synthase TruB [Nocardioides scoriae]SDR68939.1 tRNA pseudouridine synthase B [Nocardioides scoriae]